MLHAFFERAPIGLQPKAHQPDSRSLPRHSLPFSQVVMSCVAQRDDLSNSCLRRCRLLCLTVDHHLRVCRSKRTGFGRTLSAPHLRLGQRSLAHAEVQIEEQRPHRCRRSSGMANSASLSFVLTLLTPSGGFSGHRLNWILDGSHAIGLPYTALKLCRILERSSAFSYR